MLRVHFMQQWFTLSDPAMEEALHDVPLFREFAGLTWDTAVPDETTILRFRRLLEEHKLAPQILALINELISAKGLLLPRVRQQPLQVVDLLEVTTLKCHYSSVI